MSATNNLKQVSCEVGIMNYIRAVFKYLSENYFAIFCIVLDCIIYVSFISVFWTLNKDIEQRNLWSRFRIDAYLGLAEKSLELIFGQSLAGELQDDEKRRGAIWWPSWGPKGGKVAQLRPGEIGALRLYNDNGRLVYVWFVEDSNHTWRVVKDISLPLGAVE